MRIVSPSKYAPPPPRPGWIWHAIHNAFEAAVAWLTVSFVERMVLGGITGRLLWPAMLHVLAPRLAVLERGFDPDFYLRQFSDGRRQRVARAPLLHYALVGWRTRRAPAPAFDPAFYRRQQVQLPAGMDPLFHYLENARFHNVPLNEVEARAGRPPWREGAEAVLVFHHGRGGGSSRFLDSYERAIEAGGRNVLRARTILAAPTLAVIDDRVFDLATDLDGLVRFARRQGVTRILVNHLIDRPVETMEWLRDLGKQLAVPYDVVLHDYFMLCPRVNLVTGLGTFCDVAPPEVCVQCVTKHGAEARDFDPSSWRAEHLAFLAGASRIIAPSDDLAARMQPFLSKLVTVWEPESDANLPAEQIPRLLASEHLRIVTLGALNVGKGVRVVAGLADAAYRNSAPLLLSILGEVSEELPASVAVSGPYSSEDTGRLLAEAAPHAVLLPAIWPETWSFVLTSALEQGLPVIAFDIGAPAARLRRLGRGYVLPRELSTDHDKLLAALMKLRESWVVG